MKYSKGFAVFLSLALPVLSIANEAVEPRFTGNDSIDLLNDGFKNWDVPSDLWKLEDVVIIGDTGGVKIHPSEWVYTKQRFSDFEFTCEMRLTGDQGRNTGIYYRVNTFKFKDSYDAPSGYEFDAAFHRPGKRNYRGTLGDWYARPKLRIFPDSDIISDVYKEEDWNRMTLRARGNRLEYWMNGIKVMDFRDPDPKGSLEGTIGFQIHGGTVMKVEYRNIRVREL